MASGPFDLIGPPATTRTSNRRHRLLAGDQEQRSGVVHVRVEVGKFVAFSGRMPSGGRLARRHRARLNASEMRGVMGKAAGCANPDNLHRCIQPEESFMDLQMNGTTALVTGGSAGIGKAIAFALAREGVDVAICARRKERLEATASQIARE